VITQKLPTDDFKVYVVNSKCIEHCNIKGIINSLTPNDPFSGRTAPLTSKSLHFLYLFNKYRY